MNINMSGGKVTINGKTFECNGSLSIDGNGNVKINGSNVDTIVEKEISVHVTGCVENLKVTSGKVTIDGDVEGNVSSVSGGVTVKGDVIGDISTVSGSVKAEKILGKVKTVSGNIN